MMKIMVGHCIIKQTLFKNGIVRESTAFNPNNKEKEFEATFHHLQLLNRRIQPSKRQLTSETHHTRKRILKQHIQGQLSRYKA